MKSFHPLCLVSRSAAGRRTFHRASQQLCDHDVSRQTMACARNDLHDSIDMTSRLHNLGGWFADDSTFHARTLTKHIENPIGLATVPLAVAGPLLFTGHHAQGFISAPVATTEGALVASICRGAKALTLSGGAKTSASQQRMSVSPMFVCETPEEAVKLGSWMEDNRERIQREVITPMTSRKDMSAILKEVMPVIDMNACHVLLRFDTGDFDGERETSECAAHVTRYIVQQIANEIGVNITMHMREGAFAGAKGCSQLTAVLTRGISASASVVMPENVLQGIMYISSTDLVAAHEQSIKMSERIGQPSGFNVNVANMLGGMFTALGQDVSNVHESAVSHWSIKQRPMEIGGGITASMHIPSLVIRTRGGATELPTQSECLKLIGCEGEGKVLRLAEVIAAYCLALDISTYSAVSAGYFAEAHDNLGRNRPVEETATNK